MLEIDIKFSLENTRLSDEALKYWTYKEGEGYKFFLEKTKDLLLHLQKGIVLSFKLTVIIQIGILLRILNIIDFS